MREKYPWDQLFEDWKCAKEFGWNYWECQHTPIWFKRKLTRINSRVESISAELEREALKGARRSTNTLGASMGTETVYDKNEGIDGGPVPMKDWDTLFTSGDDG